MTATLSAEHTANLETLGEEISSCRAERGLTLRDVTQLVNERTGLSVSIGEIGRLATGKYKRVGPRAVAALAQVLDPDDALTPYRWCALAGLIHPDLSAALLDPDFAVTVGRLANRRHR